MTSSQSTASYAQSIASDIFAMISSSREQGINLDGGFQNEAISNQNMAIRYLFFTQKQLLHMGLFPKDMRKRFKASNILAIVEQHGKAVSVNLLCTLNHTFSSITSVQDVETNLLPAELNKFADAVRRVLAEDLQEAQATTSTS
ncbi:MAG: hypothetical protein CSA21_05510 [Deltaproteobacteria bacterium]|nr:MAG: hypothetical protein CSA21_05510 [Deltaproteobacteria bacterium]